MLKACSIPRYTSRLAIWQWELLIGWFIDPCLTLTVAFTLLSVYPSNILESSFLKYTESLEVDVSSIGVSKKEHSIVSRVNELAANCMSVDEHYYYHWIGDDYWYSIFLQSSRLYFPPGCKYHDLGCSGSENIYLQIAFCWYSRERRLAYPDSELGWTECQIHNLLLKLDCSSL